MSRLRKGLILINIFILAFLMTQITQAIEFKYRIIDDELKPYYTEYSNLLRDNCPSGNYTKTNRFIIELVDDLPSEENWIGICQLKINGFNIKILRPWWNAANPSDRKQLMYHELAHCMIHREHEEDNPNHYMYPSLQPLPDYVFINQAIDDIIEYCQ